MTRLAALLAFLAAPAFGDVASAYAEAKARMESRIAVAARPPVEAPKPQTPVETLPRLVYVGAEWCGPCVRKGMPELKKLLDDPKVGPAWRKMITVLDADRSAEFCRKYAVAALPHYVLIDAEGRVIARHVGPLDHLAVVRFYSTGKP